MQIQEENSRIYKQAYYFDIWRQVAPMWVLSWHAYSKSSLGKAHLFIHGMENQLNTKRLQKYLLWVGKYQTTKEEVDKHRMFQIRQKSIQLWAVWKCIYTEINFSQAYKNSYYGKSINMSLCKYKIQCFGNFSHRG